MNRAKPPVSMWLFAGVTLALASGCAAGDVQGGIETGIAQTEQISSLETAAAAAQGQGGLAASTETVAPPTAAPTLAIIDPGTFGSEGELVEQNGLWYWNGTQVVFTQHAESDGSLSVWMSLPDQTDWPLFIQSSQGVWRLGIEEWQGQFTIVNTTELSVTLAVIGKEALTGGDAQEKQITPYEIYSFSSLPPGDYDFNFSIESAEYACSLRFDQSSNYHFIVVPEGIAISEEHYTPETAAEFNILNSPLCID